MSQRRSPAEKPDPMDFLSMISGPKVDIYVGKADKHYRLPKLLLCHYSDFFESCFNGGFAETLTQSLFLPEDKVEDFEVLLEFMLRGVCPGDLDVQETGGKAVQRCVDFIEYADKYNMAAAAECVYEPLKKALQYKYASGTPIKMSGKAGKDRVARITPGDVELIFRVMPAGSKLRKLAVQGALSNNGMRVGFLKQERDVEGFASEMLAQIRASLKGDFKWTDPISGAERK